MLDLQKGISKNISLILMGTSRTRLEFLFGTEVFGFCTLMKAFLSSIAIAMLREEDEIRVLNVKIVGKRETQDEFAVNPLY